MPRRKCYSFPTYTGGGSPNLIFPTHGRNETNASRAMIDYDQMPRPVAENERIPVPFHLTAGYLDAVKQLEARASMTEESAVRVEGIVKATKRPRKD